MFLLAAALSLMTLSADPAHLYTEVSAPGESLDDFATRIAPRARDVTRDTGHEICGAFQQAGDRYRIEFSTSGSEWGCNIDFKQDGEWTPLRLTFHTHTEHGGHGFSAQDNRLKLQGYVVSFKYITKRVGNLENSKKLPLDIRQNVAQADSRH